MDRPDRQSRPVRVLVVLAAALAPLAGADPDLGNPSQQFLDWKAELESMVESRDTEIYEVDFEPLGIDRILLEDRTGDVAVYHYITFRLRNRVSDNAQFLMEHATAFNEVMAAITAEYQGAVFDTSGGPRLHIPSAQGVLEDDRLATVLERQDLKVRTRTINITVQAYDENGTRFRLFDPLLTEGPEGPQEAFNFEDLGDTRYGTAYWRVRRAIEEKEGRRLLSVHEIRQKELAPYDATVLDDEGVAQGEVYGILIFDRWTPLGDSFTVEVQGLSNKLRWRIPEHRKDEVEDYFNTRILRRTYVMEYARPGDEYFLHYAPFTMTDSGWRWEPTFQRLRHRATIAYVKYFFENIRLEQPRTEGGTYTDPWGQDKSIDYPVLHDRLIAGEVWDYYAKAREEMRGVYREKIERVGTHKERVNGFYEELIAETEVDQEGQRRRLQEWNQYFDTRLDDVNADLQRLAEDMPELQNLLEQRAP